MSTTTASGAASGWRRVSRRERCPICAHGDWCGISADGTKCICMRVESPTPTQNGGHLHVLAESPHVRPPTLQLRTSTPARDLAPMMQQWQRDCGPNRLQAFADDLGVDADALRLLGCGWTGRAFGFPMYDRNREIVGVRLRDPHSGRKWAVTGGKEGVFLPSSRPHGILLIVEGPTDAAAGLTLGFDVMGRPSCTGSVGSTAALARGRDTVVLLDADAPGRRGGEALASTLLPTVASLRVCEPAHGHKDLRAWLRDDSLTADELRSYLESQPCRRIRLRVRR